MLFFPRLFCSLGFFPAFGTLLDAWKFAPLSAVPLCLRVFFLLFFSPHHVLVLFFCLFMGLLDFVVFAVQDYSDCEDGYAGHGYCGKVQQYGGAGEGGAS